MTELVKILMLEDSSDDVELIERELKRAGLSFETRVVNRRAEFEHGLEEFRPDVVLSDHFLPTFNSVEALKIFKRIQLKLNLAAGFILVTGAVSEEFAVQCIREGANDYILKDRLKRLPASILSAIERARLDAERIQHFREVVASEAMLRETQQIAKLGSWQTDLVSGESKWSDEAYHLLGYEPGEVKPEFETFMQHVHPDDVEYVKSKRANAVSKLSEYENGFRIITRDGSVRHVSSKFIIQRDPEGHAIKVQGFLLDITQHTEHVRKIEEQNARLREIAWIQSHEVRAPLARVLGLASLLTHRDQNTDVELIFDHILESIKEMDALVRTVVRKTEEMPDL